MHTDLCSWPMLSRYWRELLPSQMWIPLSFRVRALVSPLKKPQQLLRNACSTAASGQIVDASPVAEYTGLLVAMPSMSS